MNKVLLTHLLSVVLVIVGLLTADPWRSICLSAGLFALSGALTNVLAIHMLFERVPGLYGSGVIVMQFEEFKRGIRGLIMDQFFRPENLERFFNDDVSSQIQLNEVLPPLIDELDYDKAFNTLAEAITQSSLGGMLNFIGGPSALDGLREPFAQKMKSYLTEAVSSEELQLALSERLSAAAQSESVQDRIQALVDARLNELTPEQVKIIIQSMIRRHLGWLVVWGGVVGGLMGAMFSVLLTW